MPTVLRVGGDRFFFFSNERNEPPHIHAERAENYAKFWLRPVALARNHGFRSSEVTEARQIVAAHRDEFLRAWDEYFSDQT